MAAHRWAISCALALALCALAVSACGDNGADGPAVVADPAPAPEEVEAQPRRRILRLPDEENRIVAVRRGRRVDLYDRPGGKVVETVSDETEFHSPTVFRVAERRGPWAAVPTPVFEDGRLLWLRLDPRRLRSGWVDWEVEISLSDHRAEVREGGKLVRGFTVSIGRPGSETPTGEFAVTDTFRGDLNAAYGCCAIALTARQTRLPSGWLGGDRIAIHGTQQALGVANSHGCVRAADLNVSYLVDHLPLGTPVTIRP